MIEICREHSKNVKRWRDGTMALRWCAAGMLEADHQFRRVNGHLHLPKLRAALEPGPLVILVRCRTVAKVDSMVILSRRLRRGCDLCGCVEDGVVDASGGCCDPAVNAG